MTSSTSVDKLVDSLARFLPLEKNQKTNRRGFIPLTSLRSAIIHVAGLNKTFDLYFNEEALSQDGFALVPWFMYDEFIDNMNNKFEYQTSDFARGGREIIYAQTNISIRNPTDVFNHFAALNSMPEMYTYFHTNIVYVIVLYFYSVQQPGQNFIFTTNRKLMWWDFIENLLARCSMETLRNVLDFLLPFYTSTQAINSTNSRPRIYDYYSQVVVYYVMWTFAHKMMRQEKFFIIDHWLDPTKHHSADDINALQELSLPIQLRREYQKYKVICKAIKLHPFKQLIWTIQQETELIVDLMELNILIRKHVQGDDQTKQIFEALDSMLTLPQKCKRKNFEIKKKFQCLNHVQRCLFFQVFYGIQNHSNNHQILKQILSYIKSRSPGFFACSLFFDTDNNISCSHKTFTFHVYHKWYKMLQHFLQTYSDV